MPNLIVVTPIDTFMASADQAAMRTNLGLGTAATTAATDYATAAQGATADTALQPTGSGAGLTALNASELTSGTVPDARFPATLPAVSGANLTALNANNLGSGTVPDARFPATLPAVSGVNLTALNASNLGSGAVPDARFPATLPAVSGVNLTALNASNLGSGTVPDARFPTTLPAVSGANLTALNMDNAGSGTLAVARGGTGITSLGTGVATFLGTPSSANLAAAVTDETGSGLLVFGTSPTLTTPTIAGAVTFPDDVRQTFNPGTTNPGLNVGSIAGDPSTPSNGDMWYDSTANELTARINGANVALGAGGGGLTGFTATLETASPNNTVNVSKLAASGGTTNQDIVLAAKGTGALIFPAQPDNSTPGGNKRGNYAVDLQAVRSVAAEVASGASSGLLFGQYNRATNTYAVAGGYQNIASGSVSAAWGGQLTTASGYASLVIGGYGGIASGQSSSVVGGESCTASGNYSLATGFNSLADRYGIQAHASGQFAAKGDAEGIDFVLRCKTTTNAAVEMFLDGSSTRFTIPSGKLVTFFIQLHGIKSDGSAAAVYFRQYAIKNVAGTTSEVFAPVTLGTDTAAGTTVSITANDTNDALNISPTGITSEIWRWTAYVRAVETAYGT